MRAEIVKPFGFQIVNARKMIGTQQAGPVIVSADLHPALVLPDGRGRCLGAQSITINAQVILVRCVKRSV